MAKQECARCSSTDKWEIVGYKGEITKDGKLVHAYDAKCNHCGRIDPYYTVDRLPIAERTEMRAELQSVGALANSQVAPGSDQNGAPA